MKATRFWRVLAAYLREQARDAGMFLLFTGIFFVVYFLYHIPMEPALYAALLCAVIKLFALAGGFPGYYQKHVVLQTALAGIRTQLTRLPVPSSLLERDYQALMEALQKERVRLVSQTDQRAEEQTEYYTLWAHQIKTPIAAMRLLLQEEADRKYRAELEGELFQIEKYVEMVLQYLRLESMSSDLLLKEYALDGIVRQAVKQYAPVFIHKKLALRYDTLPGTVLTDEKWLAFVIEQLLSNALKYTTSGYVSIYLQPGRKKTLVIEDTGIGIRKEDVPRIFERGFTGYNGRMDKRSTGIGLYLCKRVTARLSHGIWIESELGRGTRVFLDLFSEPLEVE